jgi:hypothetical protein
MKTARKKECLMRVAPPYLSENPTLNAARRASSLSSFPDFFWILAVKD